MHGHGVVVLVDLVEVPRVGGLRVFEEIEPKAALLLSGARRVDLQGFEEGGHPRFLDLDGDHHANRSCRHLGERSSLHGERREGSGAGEQRAGPYQVLEEHHEGLCVVTRRPPAARRARAGRMMAVAERGSLRVCSTTAGLVQLLALSPRQRESTQIGHLDAGYVQRGQRCGCTKRIEA